MGTPVIQIRTPAETALIERFAAEKSTLPGAAQARAAAFARFEAKGLPGRRVESYHYTDLRNLMRALAPPATGTAGGVTLLTVDEPRIGFRDGRLERIDAMPAGVVCEALGVALGAGTVLLGAGMGAAADVVVDLNTALVREGVVVRVAPGATVASPIAIAYDDASAAPIHATPRVIVEVGEGASVTLVEHVTGAPGVPYQVNSVVELILGAGAKVEHIRINEAGDKALVLSSLAARLGEGAELNALALSTGGDVSRHQVFVTYAGEHAKVSLRGATMLRGRQHHDTTLHVDHAVPHGESRELFKTVVDGEAQGVFQGKIIVRPHAQKTDGQMASNALLLSDEAGMSNKPELEIFADDVVCAHGATCGALDENQLFYLMARGLPRTEAEALLVEAFLGEALDGVSDDSLREALATRVSAWLKNRKPVA